MLLTVNGIKKSFVERVLFDQITFGIDEHDKIGFVGSNGAGKTTLFKILTGELSYDAGNIFKNKDLKIGYLDQYSCNDSQKTVFDEVLTVFEDLIKVENELLDIQYEIENKSGCIDSLVEKQHRLSEEFERRDGFLYKSRIRSTLIGLGFSEEELSRTVEVLSGGEKTRVSLAKILLSQANLLLLDEPTNHLDIESVEWLENFLKSYKGAFIVISHDRYFLDRVTHRTFELENAKFYAMNGNYSAFAAQREIDKLTDERNYANTTREIERLEKIVEQQRRWNRERNIRTAESKLKVIDRLKETLVVPDAKSEEADFRFRACPGGGNDVLITENLAMSFSKKPLFENINIHITKGERIFLLGPNGSGKTTLLKIILGQLKPEAGDYKIGANTWIGYYDQLQESLHTGKNVLDEVWDEYPKLTQTAVRNALAAFLFKGEDVYKEIGSLSGGERARVELVKLILKKVNFLIMDEPTNHLDIQSREALEKALVEYDGTLFMVSHDRYFINSIATRILRIDANGITSFDGNYDYYIEKYKEMEIEEAVKIPSQSGLSYKEQKRTEAEKRKRQRKLDQTEKDILSVENEINALNEKLLTPEISSDYVEASQVGEVLAEKNEALEALYAQWEQLHAEAEDEE